ELACRILRNGPWTFASHHGRARSTQSPRSGIDGVGAEVVGGYIRDVREPATRVHGDAIRLWARCDRTHEAQGARGGIDGVGRDAFASAFMGDISELTGWVQVENGGIRARVNTARKGQGACRLVDVEGHDVTRAKVIDNRGKQELAGRVHD